MTNVEQIIKKPTAKLTWPNGDQYCTIEVLAGICGGGAAWTMFEADSALTYLVSPVVNWGVRGFTPRVVLRVTDEVVEEAIKMGLIERYGISYRIGTASIEIRKQREITASKKRNFWASVFAGCSLVTIFIIYYSV